MIISTQNIPHDHIRQVVETHRKAGSLHRIVETTYLDNPPTLDNDTLSVTYTFENGEDAETIVLGYGAIIPTPDPLTLHGIYQLHAELCNVHETMVYTDQIIYVATYIKEN